MQRQIASEQEKRMANSQSLSAQKYEAGMQEHDILRKTLERQFEEALKNAEIRAKQQQLDWEQKKQEIELRNKEKQQEVELKLKLEREAQARKHEDENHKLAKEMKKEQHKFEQQMQHLTTTRKMAIEEEFSKKLVLDVQMTGPNPDRQFRIRASNQCSEHLLKTFIEAMQRPAVEAGQSTAHPVGVQQNVDADEP